MLVLEIALGVFLGLMLALYHREIFASLLNFLNFGLLGILIIGIFLIFPAVAGFIVGFSKSSQEGLGAFFAVLAFEIFVILKSSEAVKRILEKAGHTNVGRAIKLLGLSALYILYLSIASILAITALGLLGLLIQSASGYQISKEYTPFLIGGYVFVGIIGGGLFMHYRIFPKIKNRTPEIDLT